MIIVVLNAIGIQGMLLADIPGIIEGAHKGKGLGIRFLRHIERNALLLFMVAADADDISHEYAILLNELEKYNPELIDKPRILAISKSDMLDDEMKALLDEEINVDVPHLYLSSVTQQGITELKDAIWTSINTEF